MEKGNNYPNKMRFKAFGVLGIALVLALASGFQTQAEKNTFLSRKKWYMSFEITLTGSGTVRKELVGGAFSSRTWRVNRSAQGDLVLDLPMPDLFPSSVPPSEVITEGGTGRFIGWIPAPLEDKDLEDMLSRKFANPALNPGYVHLAYRVDDAEQLRGRGAGEVSICGFLAFLQESSDRNPGQAHRLRPRVAVGIQ